MGGRQVEQPVLCKVVVGPAMIVDQTEPTVSSDPLFEGRQHALCPDRVFGPAPAEQDVSDLCSRFRHWRRLCFTRFVHRTSIFLRPFAPPELPGFNATTDALTPERPLFRTPPPFRCSSMNTRPAPSGLLSSPF